MQRQVQAEAEANFSDAMACLANYDWPGNVRELENAMERALVLGSSEVILPEDLRSPSWKKKPPPGIVREVPRGCQRAEEKFDRERPGTGARQLTRKPPVFWGAWRITCTDSSAISN